jgi:hypothetical protein
MFLSDRKGDILCCGDEDTEQFTCVDGGVRANSACGFNMPVPGSIVNIVKQ